MALSRLQSCWAWSLQHTLLGYKAKGLKFRAHQMPNDTALGIKFKEEELCITLCYQLGYPGPPRSTGQGRYTPWKDAQHTGTQSLHSVCSPGANNNGTKKRDSQKLEAVLFFPPKYKHPDIKQLRNLSRIFLLLLITKGIREQMEGWRRKVGMCSGHIHPAQALRKLFLL